MKKKIKTKSYAEIELPSLPNFIKVDGHMTPVGKISDSNLKKLGQLWTQELIALARKRRKSNV